MFPVFDLRTIFLVGACTTALGAMTFLSLARMYRPTAASMRRYALALAAMAIGLTLLSLRGGLPVKLAPEGAAVFVIFVLPRCDSRRTASPRATTPRAGARICASA